MKKRTKKIFKKMIIGILSVIVLIVVGGLLFLQHPMFGKLPDGERLERIKQSSNYQNNVFKNLSPTQTMVGNQSKITAFYKFFFEKVDDLRPAEKLPAIKTDLKNLPADDLLVWMGHSSLYMQLDGKKIAVDPVMISASPVSFINKAFDGANDYKPSDLPDLDYLIITHDHWDHLDYYTMIELKNRVKKIICPLGVGAHFEHWGFEVKNISELDWHDAVQLDENIKITALPARHFSGRGLTANRSLWAGYMLQTSSFGNIYLSGDTGYDVHFQQIKKEFGEIDFAVLENGQYNDSWKYIHIIPEDLEKAIKELQPKRLMTVHNSKFALAKHAWYEPLDKIRETADKNGFNLITPMMGETVILKDSTQTFKKWW